MRAVTSSSLDSPRLEILYAEGNGAGGVAKLAKVCDSVRREKGRRKVGESVRLEILCAEGKKGCVTARLQGYCNQGLK